ncbi:hypothetical protein TRFO_30333 [Tritrichomonas foetus]|uniref:Conserved oligomeric Golgi complex subunit 2 n=1 Tax=Tritrichomonas foetus TaxID=1144522 RepID=A0A1J4JTR1_9EUKA|nr:hypothetical protein TRFO_30333 [Tritrichomonas foetus]|eukprot:OHT02503.1 hypothetical protein TRFO_30333 [Tritrichomonas foetus]
MTSKSLEMISWKLADFLEPSWTNPDDFLTKFKDNFEDLRSFSASLSQFTDTLKSQLTNIIHDDYTEFVSISKQLLQLGDTMGALLKSLHTAEKAVAKASSTLEASSQPIKVHSDKLHNIRHEYAVCALALEAIEHLQLIESQLNQVDNNIYKLLDISIGFAVTKAKIIGLDQPSEQKPIETEYDRLHSQFENILKNKFLEFLSKRQHENLALVFNTAVMSGSHTFLQKAFGEVIKSNLHLTEQVNKRGGNASTILPLLINYLEDPNGDLKYLISNAPDSFDFLLYSFWESVSSWLDFQITFPIGDPVEQMKSYQQLNTFFSLCESLCRSNEAVLSIRNSPITARIHSKLRLDIYAQLISNKFLLDAEKMFSEPLQPTGKNFFLTFTDSFVEFYAKIFNKDIFIIEQSKDFAIIGMKLIASLSNFAKNSEQSFKPFFVADLLKVGDFLLKETPEFLQAAMKIAIDSLKVTSNQIKEELVSFVTEKCVEHLKYIGNLTAVGIKTNRLLKPSDEATASINFYVDWAKNSKEACSDTEFLTIIVNKLLDEFLSQSSKQLGSIQKTFETIQKFRQTKSPSKSPKQNMFNIETVQNQLKTDLEYISNVARSRNVMVDSFPVYKEIMELLTKDLSSSLNVVSSPTPPPSDSLA